MNTSTIPSRASDSGPSTTICRECGETYTDGHDCTTQYNWIDWAYVAEENIKAATRIACDDPKIQRRMRLALIANAEAAILKAKELL
jgi:hypothetical protein